MEDWIMYAIVAALFIAGRDIFTKHYSAKYTTTEHLLYYYVLCGLFIGLYTLYKRYYVKETIRCIEGSDVWKYAMIAFISVIIISPCQTLSLKHCSNPGKSKAVVNLNTVFAFLLGIFFLKQARFTMKTFVGIGLTIMGIYFVVV